ADWSGKLFTATWDTGGESHQDHDDRCGSLTMEITYLRAVSKNMFAERILLCEDYVRSRSQMSEKVVLPKFDLPGDAPNPAIRALWIVGGLLAVSLLVLGGAMWRHHSLQLAAEARAEALIATRAAEAAAAKEQARARVAEAEAKAATA